MHVPCMLTVQLQTAVLDYVLIFHVCRHTKMYSFCRTVLRSTVMTDRFTKLISHWKCALRSVWWKLYCWARYLASATIQFMSSVFWGLRSVDGYLFTDGPREAICPILRNQANSHCLTRGKNRKFLKPRTKVYCRCVQYERANVERQ
jgi:hypothetical protein